MPKTKKAKASLIYVVPKKAAGSRGRGRPPSGENGLLDKRMIIACAFELAKTTPLQEISVVRIARELGVTTTLIHYYLKGRDVLTSGVMNSFYGELLRAWPAPVGHWRKDLEKAAHRIYETYVDYAGVAAYVVAHNRFRLVQMVGTGEADNGLLFFERFVGLVHQAGFDAGRTGMYANLLMEFIISAAYATVRHRWPGDHGELLKRAFAKLNPKEFPFTHSVRREYVNFSDGLAFTDGMNLTLSGLDLERTKRLAALRRAAPRDARSVKKT